MSNIPGRERILLSQIKPVIIPVNKSILSSTDSLRTNKIVAGLKALNAPINVQGTDIIAISESFTASGD